MIHALLLAVMLASPAVLADDLGYLSATTTGTGYRRCKLLEPGTKTAIVNVSVASTSTAGNITWLGSWDITNTATPTLFQLRGINLTSGQVSQTSTVSGTYLVPVPGMTRMCINYVGATSSRLAYNINTSAQTAQALTVPTQDVTAASSSFWCVPNSFVP